MLRTPSRGRISLLMVYDKSDREGHLRAAVFQQELEKLGWKIDGNLQVDYYWGVDDYDWARSAVTELLKSAPDVIVANGGPAIKAVQESSRTIPIIFIGSADPIADGFVRTLAHPGGNMTGFTVWEPGMGAKMLQLLREIAPLVARVGVLLNPNSSSAPRNLRFGRGRTAVCSGTRRGSGSRCRGDRTGDTGSRAG